MRRPTMHGDSLRFQPVTLMNGPTTVKTAIVATVSLNQQLPKVFASQAGPGTGDGVIHYGPGSFGSPRRAAALAHVRSGSPATHMP